MLKQPNSLSSIITKWGIMAFSKYIHLDVKYLIKIIFYFYSVLSSDVCRLKTFLIRIREQPRVDLKKSLVDVFPQYYSNIYLKCRYINFVNLVIFSCIITFESNRIILVLLHYVLNFIRCIGFGIVCIAGSWSPFIGFSWQSDDYYSDSAQWCHGPHNGHHWTSASRRHSFIFQGQ